MMFMKVRFLNIIYPIEDADNEHIDILDDEKSISHKWMITLEETLLKMSGGKLQLSKFGMHSKDFSKLEGKIAPELETRGNELAEIESDYQLYERTESKTFAEYYIPKIKDYYDSESVNLK